MVARRAERFKSGDVITVAHLDGEWAVVDVLDTQLFVESCDHDGEAFVFTKEAELKK